MLRILFLWLYHEFKKCTCLLTKRQFHVQDKKHNQASHDYGQHSLKKHKLASHFESENDASDLHIFAVLYGKDFYVF